MLISRVWLAELLGDAVDLAPLSDGDLTAALTGLGLEVEGVTRTGAGLEVAGDSWLLMQLSMSGSPAPSRSSTPTWHWMHSMPLSRCALWLNRIE